MHPAPNRGRQRSLFKVDCRIGGISSAGVPPAVVWAFCPHVYGKVLSSLYISRNFSRISASHPRDNGRNGRCNPLLPRYRTVLGKQLTLRSLCRSEGHV